MILADAYGYGVELPSSKSTAHVTLDSQTGTLLVQGRTGGLNDAITIDTVGDDLRVQVNGTTERVPIADVTQIILARNGGTDTVTIDQAFTALVKEVDYVVSSNEDSADAGTVGDGIVDLDANVPGNQVALRAAVRDAKRRLRHLARYARFYDGSPSRWQRKWYRRPGRLLDLVFKLLKHADGGVRDHFLGRVTRMRPDRLAIV